MAKSNSQKMVDIAKAYQIFVTMSVELWDDPEFMAELVATDNQAVAEIIHIGYDDAQDVSNEINVLMNW